MAQTVTNFLHSNYTNKSKIKIVELYWGNFQIGNFLFEDFWQDANLQKDCDDKIISEVYTNKKEQILLIVLREV